MFVTVTVCSSDLLVTQTSNVSAFGTQAAGSTSMVKMWCVFIAATEYTEERSSLFPVRNQSWRDGTPCKAARRG